MEYKIETIKTEEIQALLNLIETPLTGNYPEFYATVYDGEELIGILLINEVLPGGFTLPYRYVKEAYRRKQIGEELYRFCCLHLLSLDRMTFISFKSALKRSGWVSRRLKEGFMISGRDEKYNVFFGQLDALKEGFK